MMRNRGFNGAALAALLVAAATASPPVAVPIVELAPKTENRHGPAPRGKRKRKKRKCK